MRKAKFIPKKKSVGRRNYLKTLQLEIAFLISYPFKHVYDFFLIRKRAFTYVSDS